MLLGAGVATPLAQARQDDPPVKLGADKRLVYATDASGQRVLDFSHAGFAGGGVPLPLATARVRVEPGDGDDGARLQAALDEVARLPLDATTGLRGAVVLAPGRYEIAGKLRLRASGVVLRGAGPDEERGSLLVATGTSRRALLQAGAPTTGDTAPATSVASVRVTKDVAAGASQVRVASPKDFSVGGRVVITRPSSAAWIKHLGMDESPARQPYAWRPGACDVRWDRIVTAIKADLLTLDAPLTVSLEQRFGGATVALVSPAALAGELNHIGIEHLRCVSAFDATHPADEQHAWDAIRLDGVRDAWVSDVVGAHFAGSLVRVGEGSARVTVQDCVSLAPVSEDGGYRRVTFHTAGQQTLFLRCRSEHGRHDFTAGYLAAGPNVFLDCTSRESTSFSGSLGSWATGLLFDGVSIDGAALRLENLETWNQGVGWNAAHSVAWGSAAAQFIVRSPPGALNWAVGVWGQFVGDGRWAVTNEFPAPKSLYRAQLAERLGPAALEALEPRAYPTVPKGVPLAAGPSPVAAAPEVPGLALTGGWLTAGGRLLVGSQTGTEWWLGRIDPDRARTFKLALTRFAPGREGHGFTDDLAAVVSRLADSGHVALRHHWGLWYDRRRIDHQMIRRPDADVWPPFYELPWARSGQGRAWDGLSRYDLTRFNPWYFERLWDFAAAARARGRVLIHEMYFQHNILESGAHWVDFAWRPVNALQLTGFTEPPPFTGDTIKMAAEFYDVSHPQRRDLHRRYIRECLARLADQPNVVHTLTAENSGPLPFMQFWLDVIAEWRHETGRDVLVALSAPKDVQDAILADVERAPLIDVIDLTYWWRDDTGREFAPAGGTDLAPRQHQRETKVRPAALALARMVQDYRVRFPEKAVISGLPQHEGWAFAAAGGSFPEVPVTTVPELLAALPRLRPIAARTAAGSLHLASLDGAEHFVYAPRGQALRVDLTGVAGSLRALRVDLATGRLASESQIVTGGSVVNLARDSSDRDGPAACWLTR